MGYVKAFVANFSETPAEYNRNLRPFNELPNYVGVAPTRL
jgi:hypothetical protein